jgi:hypothetical protein
MDRLIRPIPAGRRVRLTSWVVGVLFLVLALVWALRQGGAAFDQAEPVRRRLLAKPSQALAMAGLVWMNLLLTAELVGSITRCFVLSAPVSRARMLALISASSLLNYLPMRPGLIGRAAYLKQVHGLSLRDSGISLMVVLSLGLLVLLMVAATLSVDVWSNGWLQRWGRWALGFTLLAVASLAWWRWSGHLEGLFWTPLKLLDLLCGAGRLWLAVGLLGASMPYELAVLAMALGSLLAMTGLTPNGMGLREWSAAGVAEAVQPGLAGPVLLAGVLDRAIEAAVVCPTGVAGIAWLGLGRTREAGGEPG